jgi:hypothetical protein
LCAIEVIRREKKKSKKLQVELDKKEDTHELEQMITNLKVQIEEDKRIEESLKEQLEGRDLSLQGCRLIGKCHVNGRKYVKRGLKVDSHPDLLGGHACGLCVPP